MTGEDLDALEVSARSCETHMVQIFRPTLINLIKLARLGGLVGVCDCESRCAACRVLVGEDA
jgi:hypothetical protein